MRTMILSVVTAGVLAAAPAPASAGPATYGQVLADAQRVRQEAHEVGQLLRSRQIDQAVVRQRVSALEAHAQALRTSIDGLDVAAAGLNAMQMAAFERARAATDTLIALLQNKTALVADAERLERERRLARAKAEGIAARARIIEQQMTRLRG